ncbi:hypothetical protein LTR91_020960 [Friedmanniomyces endolithicus]|uniref:DUF3074 domain-containing protein n=1 Tax=Friedmanniomyces endolithicus TaxID=329885 RepID=A0AAN6JZY8_9PEZI|nr:hypothetical protein LTR94_018114 [Friedmanniomyces endolithicus]KAK0789710.1 hypothetical protein LTR59_009564 [Friedmanniomyces endolithicus]KAK0879707.1 hypothetical protein LTR87_006509 [Friedmanniomyces endolithicus]KAK0889988.1 hypothetical protein LTR02_015039 [Friedmanniomyces endolithicus]KAK0923304.1 hypothetical protein LTR57_007042 [Friedmanniomyces endolithicus]
MAAASSAVGQPQSQPQMPSQSISSPGQATAPTALGKYVRMRHLQASELPAHPAIAPLQSSGTPPNLHQFLVEVLEEAEAFMIGYLPLKFKVKSSSKSSPPATASVELLTHEINAADIPKEARTAGAGSAVETWFARTSVHENAAKEGTASWEEFDRGLRADHSQHEMEYTPDVQDAHLLLSWHEAMDSFGQRVGTWEDVGMSVVEMVHHIPPPLNDRVFPELVITARKAGELLVVQIPVEIKGMQGAAYNSNKTRKLQDGMYCSIERAELLDGGANVKWQMATASDAKGILPMWMQKMGVPGAVVKDVGLFIGWTGKKRQGKA